MKRLTLAVLLSLAFSPFVLAADLPKGSADESSPREEPKAGEAGDQSTSAEEGDEEETSATRESAGATSADEILDKVDENLTFETRTARVTMVVEGRRTRTFEMQTYARGLEDAAIEYLSPPRERGTRMLKLGDELWMYMPAIDRVQKISGHMLREGMMGSDVSYEDLMESPEMREMYDAELVGEEDLDGQPTWKLEMTAKDRAVTYPRRVIWVDKGTFIPLKQELYALDDMLLKTWTMSEIEEFEEERRFPTRMTIEDHVIEDSVTRLEFANIEFGVDLEEEVFSLRWVERR